MYCSSHLFPIHIIYTLIFPFIRDKGPRYKWVGKSLVIEFLAEGFCVFRNGLISISDWVFGNVWSCSTLFIMKKSHKCDELKKMGGPQIGYLWLDILNLFCGHSSSSQECVTVDINLGTVWSLFYYWKSKLIN
jgi:hypothetical protein